jgi:hypothetical protein
MERSSYNGFEVAQQVRFSQRLPHTIWQAAVVTSVRRLLIDEAADAMPEGVMVVSDSDVGGGVAASSG